MDTKKQLQDLIVKIKEKQFKDQASTEASNVIRDESKGLLATIQGEQTKALVPVFDKMSKDIIGNIHDAISSAVKGLKVDVPKIDIPQVHVNVPDVHVPAFKIPTPQVTVNVPKQDPPHVTVSPQEVTFPDSMAIHGFDNKHPLPVQLVDIKGRPYEASNGASIGGGKGDFFTIQGFNSSIAASLIDSSGIGYSGSNPLPITGSLSTSPFATYYASDAVGSMNLVQYGGNNVATGLNETNAGVFRTVIMTDSVTSVYANNPSGQGDSATALRILQAGDAVASINILQINGNTPATGLNETTNGVIRTVQMTDSVSSVVVNSGTLTAVTTLTNITNSIQVVNLDRDGNPWAPYTFGAGELATALRTTQAGDSVSSVIVNSGTITTVTTLTGITNTIAVANIDSTGSQYSGSNPFPMTIVSGALTSTISVGDSAARSADNGGNPVKIGGIARTTNPTAYADGDRSNFSSDKIGRQLVRPLQVRDLIATAYVSVSTGTETTLLAAAGAGVFLDCIALTATNNSTAAIQVDIRSSTAGSIVHTMYLPASTGPVGWALPIPYPQDNTNNNWTVDLPDVTGTTVYFTGLFSKEI